MPVNSSTRLARASISSAVAMIAFSSATVPCFVMRREKLTLIFALEIVFSRSSSSSGSFVLAGCGGR